MLNVLLEVLYANSEQAWSRLSHFLIRFIYANSYGKWTPSSEGSELGGQGDEDATIQCSFQHLGLYRKELGLFQPCGCGEADRPVR